MHFLSGLPRSGSTVLTKLLSQNPKIFASSTSPLIEYIIPASAHLNKIKAEHSSGHYVDVNKILLSSAFAFHDDSKEVIIDKNRGWISNYENINRELIKDPKIIVTFRPIEEVMSSFYKILNIVNNGNETPEHIFSVRIKDVYLDMLNKSYLKDKICIVTYKQILTQPSVTLQRVESFLNVEHHTYDFNNIKDEDPENDDKWGIPNLHTIRKTLSNESIDPSSILTKTELNFCKQLTRELYDAYSIDE